MQDFEKLFESLSKTESGKLLVAYCEKMMAELCDIRNHKEPEDGKAALIAAKAIQTKLIDKIKLRNDFKKRQVNPFE